MDTRLQYMKRIKSAIRLRCPTDAAVCEEAAIVCLVTSAMAHRRIPFQMEAVETISNRLLEELERLLGPSPE